MKKLFPLCMLCIFCLLFAGCGYSPEREQSDYVTLSELNAALTDFTVTLPNSDWTASNVRRVYDEPSQDTLYYSLRIREVGSENEARLYIVTNPKYNFDESEFAAAKVKKSYYGNTLRYMTQDVGLNGNHVYKTHAVLYFASGVKCYIRYEQETEYESNFFDMLEWWVKI